MQTPYICEIADAGPFSGKGEKFGEVVEWTMLDRKYDDHTRDVFSGGPVFLPLVRR